MKPAPWCLAWTGDLWMLLDMQKLPLLLVVLQCQQNSRDFFFFLLRFEFRALCLPGKCFTTWAMLSGPFSLPIFQTGSHDFVQPSLEVWFSYLCLPCSWDYRHISPLPTCFLRWCLTDFLPRLALNHDLLNLCLPSRCEPPCPAAGNVLFMGGYF
jgi:hypothetical protein